MTLIDQCRSLIGTESTKDDIGALTHKSLGSYAAYPTRGATN
jgi:hypothetical protein